MVLDISKGNQPKKNLVVNSLSHGSPASLLSAMPISHRYIKDSPFLKDTQTPIDLKQYHVGNHKMSQVELQQLQMRFNKVAINTAMSSELGVGIYQLMQSQKNPVDLIAHNLKQDPIQLAQSVGNTDALQSLYHNATKMYGMATICAGFASLVRLGTAIYDTMMDIKKTKNNQKNNEKRQELLKDFAEKTKNNTISSKEIDKFRKHLDGEFDRLVIDDKKFQDKISQSRKVTTDINVASTLVSGAGSLLTAKCMVDSISNSSAIQQAVSALCGGVATTAKTVLAIKFGMGLLAAGITTSALVSVAGVVDHFIKRVRHQDNDKQKTDNLSGMNKRLIALDIMSGTSQILSGVGDITLIKHNPGFGVNALLNWGELFMHWKTGFQLDKLLTFAGAGFMLLGGVGSLASAGYKVAQNQKMKKMSEDEKKAMLEKMKIEHEKSLMNNSMMTAKSQMMMI